MAVAENRVFTSLEERWNKLSPEVQRQVLEHMEAQPIETPLNHWSVKALCFPKLFLKHYKICRKTFPVISSMKLAYGWTNTFLFY